MVYHHRVFIVGVILVVCASAALGAAPSGAISGRITDDIKKKDTPPYTAREKENIRNVVNGLVAALSNPDPAEQKNAREALVAELKLMDKKDSSAMFVDEYCKTLSDALLKGPMAQQNMKLRLQAGLVVAAAAETAPSFWLESVILRLMGKGAAQPDAVVLWGIKAARPVILNTLMLNVGKKSDLLPEVVPAAKAHPLAPVIAEAYNALIIEVDLRTPKPLKNQINLEVMPELLKLLDYRVALYQKAIPDDPELEPALPIKHLTRVSTWESLSQKQQLQVAQALHNLLGMAAKQAAAMDAPPDAVLRAIRETAICVKVMAKASNNEALAGMTGDVEGLPSSVTGQQVEAAVTPVLKGLKDSFKGLAPLPPVANK